MNLDDIEKVVNEVYHKDGSPGRPPRKPIGIFKALMVKRLQQVPSERELCRRLWKAENLRELCDIEAEEKPYHPSQLSRFRRRMGVSRLLRILNKLVKKLLNTGLISGETVVLDAAFVKGYSRRDLHDNSRGKSDPEARVAGTVKLTNLATSFSLSAEGRGDFFALFRICLLSSE